MKPRIPYIAFILFALSGQISRAMDSDLPPLFPEIDINSAAHSLGDSKWHSPNPQTLASRAMAGAPSSKNPASTNNNVALLQQIVQPTNQFVQSSSATSVQKPYECETCSRRFANRQSIKNHDRIYHEGLRFTCPACLKFYRGRWELKEHIIKKHPEIDISRTTLTPFLCAQPNPIEPQPSNNNLQAQEVHPQSLSTLPAPELMQAPAESIEQCQYPSSNNTATWYSLSPHALALLAMAGTPSSKNPASTNNNVALPQQIVQPTNQLAQSSSATSVQKPYECETCGRRFVNRHSLKEHRLIHHLGLRYTCPACLKKHRGRWELKVHIIKKHPEIDISRTTLTPFLCAQPNPIEPQPSNNNLQAQEEHPQSLPTPPAPELMQHPAKSIGQGQYPSLNNTATMNSAAPSTLPDYHRCPACHQMILVDRADLSHLLICTNLLLNSDPNQ